MEIKLLKATEVVGVSYKKGDIVDCAPSIAEKYIKAKLGEPVLEIEEVKESVSVEVFPETGSIKAEGH